jgi:predicted small lipoprotein YifL
MKTSFSAITGLFVAATLFTAACGKPKQAEVPDADKDNGGQDMAGEETAAKPDEGDKPAGEGDMREKCCASCQEALKADRSGQAPDQIPCSDFTAAMSPWCLEYFRAHPTKAAECSAPAK